MLESSHNKYTREVADNTVSILFTVCTQRERYIDKMCVCVEMTKATNRHLGKLCIHQARLVAYSIADGFFIHFLLYCKVLEKRKRTG